MITRRNFLAAAGALTLAPPRSRLRFNVAEFDRARTLRNAQRYLLGKPFTVTAARCTRSAGGPHDFFSEGDDWWPDPNNPDGPYIQREGMANPDNFIDHRRFLMRLSVQVPALAAAYLLTQESRFAEPAAAHLRAWFVDDSTRLNPGLQFAQAVHGRSTGRAAGIVETIHFVEVVRAIPVLLKSGSLSAADSSAIHGWFASYLEWLTTSANGLEERDTKNNHATSWLLQVAAFAQFTGNNELLKMVGERFRTVLVPGQIDPQGTMPLELNRTKPYSYCLFNLEALGALCQILTEAGETSWEFATPDRRSVPKAIDYMYPFIRNKSSWPHQPDVMYFEYWPMRQNFLLFAAMALQNYDYLDLWKRLPADSDIDEVIRNYFIRQPSLWV